MKTRLEAFAELLWELYQRKDLHAAIEISNYHNRQLGKSPEEIVEAKLSFDDILDTIRLEYGFTPSQRIDSSEFTEVDFLFEETVDQLLCGRIDEWEPFLRSHPYILPKRSLYGHQATLLNYCGNNGIEIWRQVVPLNLEQRIRILLHLGANKEDKIKVYGGEFTTLELFATSAHPFEAEIDRGSIQKLLSTASNPLE